MNERKLFQQYLAPTSEDPMLLSVVSASGATLYDHTGKEYIDLIGGISVCNVGHCHPKVVEAIEQQSRQFLHVMVYGEVVQSPQVRYAQMLCRHLPASLDCVYFTNSGAEAVEGAMKLAKRLSGRPEIIACHNSYHGSTQGALSLLGDEYWRQAYRPLLPGIRHIQHNNFDSLEAITTQTAAVIIEPIQAEAGVLTPSVAWMQALQKRCSKTGTLLILDEIQTGFGRTGTLWAFEQFDIIPDMLLLGKALGGGMPLGAFISGKDKMAALAKNPVLGHLTTFGGHPVSCAAGMAAFKALLEEKMMDTVDAKAQLFRELLVHPAIKAVRNSGLMFAVALDSFERVQQVIHYCMTTDTGRRIFTDWFLFAPECIRIVPPLMISEDAIRLACQTLMDGIDFAMKM